MKLPSIIAKSISNGCIPTLEPTIFGSMMFRTTARMASRTTSPTANPRLPVRRLTTAHGRIIRDAPTTGRMSNAAMMAAMSEALVTPSTVRPSHISPKVINIIAAYERIYFLSTNLSRTNVAWRSSEFFLESW